MTVRDSSSRSLASLADMAEAQGYTAKQVHLPETILGHDVALSLGHVGQRGRAHVRNAPDITFHRDRTLQAGKGCGAVDLRKGTKEEPPDHAAASQDEKCQEPTDDAQHDSQQEPSKKV